MKAPRGVSTLFIISFISTAPALAQSRGRGGDVAIQATMLRLSDGDATNAGVGGRLTFDISRWGALDAEISFFPKDDFTRATLTPLPGRFVYQRNRTEGFLGIKAGHRGDRVGVFAKARPGFTRLIGKRLGCHGDVCSLFLPSPFPPEYRTEFAFDLGAIVEFYPSARIFSRIDLGDVMIRHRSDPPPCSDCTSHNFASRLGVGFRF